jgi:chromosome partitioning protein
MQTIVAANLKGGVGKSTIVASIATALHKASKRVLVIDTDTQGTLVEWGTRAAENEVDSPPVVHVTPKVLLRDLPRLGGTYDFVLIDTPARLNAEARAAMAVADLVLVPFVPRGAELWVLGETLEAIQEAKAFRPNLDALVVVNRVERRAISSLVRRALDERPEEIRVAETALRDRIAYADALLMGHGVTTYDPKGDAAHDLRRLITEVFGFKNWGKA